MSERANGSDTSTGSRSGPGSDSAHQLALRRAEEVFEDPDVARQWLSSPSLVLGLAIPLDLLNDRYGFRQVLKALAAIEHGIPP